MPVNCADFLKKVQTKKAIFGLLGKGTQWKFYIDSEIGPLLKGDKVKDDMQLVTGKAEWKINKLNVVVDGVKDDAKKALKAAYTAEKIKWEDTAVTIKGSGEDDEPGKGDGTGRPTPQQNTGATAVRPLTELQLHKVKVLNPAGPQGGAFKVPLALDDSQIAALLASLPPGTKAQRVDAGAITLETPVPKAGANQGPQQNGAASAPPLDALQLHKIKVLNPNGIQGGVFKVPMTLTDPQIAALLASLPLGTQAQRVNASAITLDTPNPTAGSGTATSPLGTAGQQQAPGRPQQAAPVKEQRPSPAVAADDNREYQQFKNRIVNLMPEITLVRSVNESLAKKATEAMNLAKTAPGQAQRLLDEVTRELNQLAAKDDWLRLAAQFRMDWEAACGGGLVKDPVLLDRRKAFEAELSSKKDYKAAVAALQKLQKLLESRQKIRKEIMHHWNPTKRREDQLAAIAKNLGLKPDQVGPLVDAALKEMQVGTDGLRPAGFELDEVTAGLGMNIANPCVPAAARPMLTLEEAQAVKLYSSGAGGDAAPYKVMNRALWKGEDPAPPLDKAYKQLQAAFAKTKPFPKPVPVARGVNFSKQEDLDKFLKPFKDAAGKNNLVPMLGFLSTGTGGVPSNFEGNVKLTILAKQGLDLAPYSESPWEAELLLNDETLVKVLKVKQKGKVWDVFVEQILPKTAS